MIAIEITNVNNGLATFSSENTTKHTDKMYKIKNGRKNNDILRPNNTHNLFECNVAIIIHESIICGINNTDNAIPIFLTS